MRRWFQIALACALIAAVLILCIAPAYSIQPTALRAWNSSFAVLALLCTLIVYAFAVPQLTEEYIAASQRVPQAGGDRLRLTCTLLI